MKPATETSKEIQLEHSLLKKAIGLTARIQDLSIPTEILLNECILLATELDEFIANYPTNKNLAAINLTSNMLWNAVKTAKQINVPVKQRNSQAN